MSQVSKRFLNQKIQDRILTLFITCITLSSTNNETSSLIDDIFTPTEKIVLSKRFSVAFMLLEGYNYEIIRQTLKVSYSTIGNISLWLKTKGKGVRKIISKIKRHETLGDIWQQIQEGIVDIMISSPGTNWREGKKLKYQLKKNHSKPF